MIKSVRVASLLLAAVLSVALPTSGALANTAEKWVCTAEKLKSYSYRGGKTATIHLSPYSKGGTYKVTVVSDTEVVGETKDGTPFTCTKAATS